MGRNKRLSNTGPRGRLGAVIAVAALSLSAVAIPLAANWKPANALPVPPPAMVAERGYIQGETLVDRFITEAPETVAAPLELLPIDAAPLPPADTVGTAEPLYEQVTLPEFIEPLTLDPLPATTTPQPAQRFTPLPRRRPAREERAARTTPSPATTATQAPRRLPPPARFVSEPAPVAERTRVSTSVWHSTGG